MNANDIVESRRCAGLVKRYATWPMLREQTTGEHSWQVMRLYCEFFGVPRSEVLYCILHHDSAEVAVGDPPFPLKAHNPALKAEYQRLEAEALVQLDITLPVLFLDELTKVKIADLLEMAEHAVHELTMGNKFAGPIATRTVQAAAPYISEITPDDRKGVLAWLTTLKLRLEEL